jgi:hypothetical protein
MSAEQSTKADEIEQAARAYVERARERTIEQASELRDRMARLVKQLEGNPEDHPPHGTGALQQAADLELSLNEWTQKREALRAVRAMRRAATIAAPDVARAS